jgi:hypothetical protein
MVKRCSLLFILEGNALPFIGKLRKLHRAVYYNTGLNANYTAFLSRLITWGVTLRVAQRYMQLCFVFFTDTPSRFNLLAALSSEGLLCASYNARADTK